MTCVRSVCLVVGFGVARSVPRSSTRTLHSPLQIVLFDLIKRRIKRFLHGTSDIGAATAPRLRFCPGNLLLACSGAAATCQELRWCEQMHRGGAICDDLFLCRRGSKPRRRSEIVNQDVDADRQHPERENQ